jgi:hypothetical protein
MKKTDAGKSSLAWAAAVWSAFLFLLVFRPG